MFFFLPILSSSEALLKWCPDPATENFTTPQIALSITMEELCLSLTKYQQQDLMMLLQSFEFISRASKFRRYKARHGLENLPNYQGRVDKNRSRTTEEHLINLISMSYSYRSYRRRAFNSFSISNPAQVFHVEIPL